MMNIILVLSVLAAVLGLTAMVMEFRRSLMMLQQNSYRNDRYSRYLRESGDSTDWMKLGALAVLFIVINTKVPTLVSSLLMVAYFTLQVQEAAGVDTTRMAYICRDGRSGGLGHAAFCYTCGEIAHG